MPEEWEDKEGSEFFPLESASKNKEEINKEGKRHDIEDLYIVNNKPDHPINLVVLTILKTSSGLLDNQLIVLMVPTK